MRRHIDISIAIKKARNNAAAPVADGVTNTTKEVFESDGGSSGNECLHSCGGDQIADRNDEVFIGHAKKRAAQTKKNAALAQAAELRLKMSRDVSKHMAVRI